MKNTFKVTVESDENINTNSISNTNVPKENSDNAVVLVKGSNPVYSTKLINVIDKSAVGRPKVSNDVYKSISTRLKVENYEYARIVGGKYGGITAYLNYLIEQDRKNNPDH